MSWDRDRFMRLKLLLAGLPVLLSGCSNAPGPIGGAPGLQVIEGGMPAPTQNDITGPTTAFGVGPLDTLKIDVFGIPELSNRTLRVDNNGQIAFPLIGTLDVAGLSTTQISALIEGQLRGQYVRDPQVTTTVEESANRTVTVYGQVGTPGVYPVLGQSTLMKSVAQARGLTKYANSRDVVVFRTVNGQRMATLYNLGAISRGAYEDPTIYPNDVVAVGESKSRQLFDDIVGAATLIATPLTILLQNN